jgi:hypothetical protein
LVSPIVVIKDEFIDYFCIVMQLYTLIDLYRNHHI